MYPYIFFLLIVSICSFEMPADWINPADIHRRTHHSKRPVGASTPETIILDGEESNSNSKSTSCSCPPHTSVCDSYFKRIVNLLLIEANVKNYRLPKGDSIISPLKLRFTSQNLEIISKFVSDDVDGLSWSDFDAAFSSLFDRFNPEPETTNNNRYVVPDIRDYSHFIFIAIVGSILFCGLWLLLTSRSLYKSVLGMLIIIFAVALVWNLIRAYNIEKEKLIKRSNKNLGVESYSFTSALFDLFSWHNDELLPADPLYNVDFGKVFIDTVGVVFDLIPKIGEKLGESIAKFCDAQGFIGKLSQLWLNFLTPVFIISILAGVILLFKDINIKLPFFSVALGSNRDSGKSVPGIANPMPLPGSSDVHRQALPRIENPNAEIYHANIESSSHGVPTVRHIIHEFYSKENNSKENPGRLNAVPGKRKGRVDKRKYFPRLKKSSSFYKKMIDPQ